MRCFARISTAKPNKKEQGRIIPSQSPARGVIALFLFYFPFKTRHGWVVKANFYAFRIKAELKQAEMISPVPDKRHTAYRLPSISSPA